MSKLEKGLLVLIVCCVQFSWSWDGCPNVCRCYRPELKMTCYVDNYNDLLNISKTIDPNATHLILRDNKLTDFNVSFNLPKLKILNLNNNLLKTIPKHLNSQFPTLKTLLLDDNEINEVSHVDFKGMVNLTKLSLKNNQITSLGKGIFQNLINLLQLLLENNSINTLSVDAFQGLSKIVKLDLSYNHISNLEPGLFSLFNNTRITIDLTSNQIKELQNGLFDNPQKDFEALELSSNQISVIEDAVFRNMNIDLLNLYNNSLFELSPDSFMNTTISSGLLVIKNNLKCSCGLRSFMIGPEINVTTIVGNCKDKNQTLDFQTISKQGFSKDEVSRLFCTQCQINNTCLNGAACHAIGKTGLTCGCVNDYYGESCENDPICLSVECQHTGRCLPIGDGSDYHCVNCTDRYYGKRCELYRPKEGLNEAEIVAIAVGVVLFIVLALILYIIIAHCLAKEQKKNENQAAKGENDGLMGKK